jgi:hypothetical protein
VANAGLVIKDRDNKKAEKTDGVAKAESVIPDGNRKIPGKKDRIIVDEGTSTQRSEDEGKPTTGDGSEKTARINVKDVEVELSKIKDVFGGDRQNAQVTKAVVEIVLAKRIRTFVLYETQLPVRRYYSMPTVSIEPTKDPDENHQVEITFNCKSFVCVSFSALLVNSSLG